MEGSEQYPCPSPYPQPFKDVSNFKTPKRPPNLSKFTSPSSQFFTASKRTPISSSSYRPSLSGQFRPKPASTTARRRLKAFEIEQSQSSRKAQIRKEQALKTLSKSLTTWLNFLFENPSACGCSCNFTQNAVAGPSVLVGLGKREGGAAGVGDTWRSPKRSRDVTWKGGGVGGDGDVLNFKRYGKLKEGLKEVCSVEDLMERMRVYLSLGCCKEVFDATVVVVKTIDEGRLKMKPHCPIVTDFGMKEKAMRILMCYNPVWLRIGLQIILGGDSLLPSGDIDSDQEISFLKMVIEKQFLSHTGLAKTYAYNRKVEGLYRPGYYESLGNVILKRFLLLVLILDRAKLQSGLSLKYGIDGVDGGSPLLFVVQSSIKSSRQMINDFLSSEVMHGEGNLLAHLVIIGYKVSYQQCSLVEYDFRVTDLFAELQDGVRLCRAIQLLQNDSSILMKMVVPSDTRKRNLANCGLALQYLKRAGVTLQDEDGMTILEDDVANGDMELTVSLLWNMFVHLQLPLLLNKTTLANEILKIHGVNMDSANISPGSSPLELLLSWIQAVCGKYDYKIDNFASLVDGKAIWCLLDYYFRKELSCSHSPKDPRESRREESLMSAIDYTDSVHNFLLSQKLTTLLWNFPEVLHISDILEHSGAINHRSVVILLVFLSSQLTVKKTMDQLNFHKLLCCDCQERRTSSVGRCSLSSEAELDQDIIDGSSTEDAARKFRAIKAWWQDMAERNNKFITQPGTSVLECTSTSNLGIIIQRENAAKVIQSHFRRSVERHNFLKMRRAASFLQTAIRAWLMVKKRPFLLKFSSVTVQDFRCERWSQAENLGRYVKFIVDRHRFVKLRRDATLIQKATRIWIRQRHKSDCVSNLDVSTLDIVNAAIAVQKFIRGWAARSRYKDVQLEKASSTCQFDGLTVQLSSKTIISRSIHEQQLAATKIQSHFQGWLLRRTFLIQKQAIMKIQSNYRCLRCRRAFQQFSIAKKSAIVIQSCVRGWIVRRKVGRYLYLIGVLQRYCRAWLIRRDFLFQKQAATQIQSAIRCLNCRTAFKACKDATIEIQRFVRGHTTRNRLLGASHFSGGIASYGNFLTSGVCFQSLKLKVLMSSVLKLQRWWRGILFLKLRTKSAIVIQAHIRGWIGRQMASRERQCVALQREAVLKIQSAVRCLNCWKAFHCCKQATIEIQGFVRGEITRNRLLGASHFHRATASYCKMQTSRVCLQSLELKIVMSSILKLQRWWRGVLLLKHRAKSAILVQSHVRGWIGRKKATRERQHVVVVQSHWKGFLARKNARGQLLDLRLRMQNSAKNVDDSMRIINRLIVALSELSSMKSVSGILHTCATLDMTTEHSQKCCEKLVAAGAIDNLLKLIRSVSQSMPDQEVLKHALSVLRNLAHYPHLIEVLIDSQGVVETILWQLLRNKEEGYFIASDVMKKICSHQKGVEMVLRKPPIIKRLHSLVEELTRKANFEKKKPRSMAVRDNMERRLREAVELLKLINSKLW
ncbi:PREDICTED: abnormal spindle-like microcephaly-associated protein homolog isoform X1 [Populus euphratica]|uniref:Abnormal spindle-like microcephaly-associated protein homolog isoform X1 n=1 Tax=Populus euphratica TaxID=75702 RepID=A0AAJ6UXY0_POPEU|nr:PREDICTED: abnormal spindle-like microcephaly-associated protein homolog isoform X1 [Populus euphratica]